MTCRRWSGSTNLPGAGPTPLFWPGAIQGGNRLSLGLEALAEPLGRDFDGDIVAKARIVGSFIRRYRALGAIRTARAALSTP